MIMKRKPWECPPLEVESANSAELAREVTRAYRVRTRMLREGTLRAVLKCRLCDKVWERHDCVNIPVHSGSGSHLVGCPDCRVPIWPGFEETEK